MTYGSLSFYRMRTGMSRVWSNVAGCRFVIMMIWIIEDRIFGRLNYYEIRRFDKMAAGQNV